MKEQFRKVVDNDNYTISSDGILKGKTGREKALRKRKDGYLEVHLYRDGIRSHKRVHRLVAEAFIPNPDNKPEVNHKDGNKCNNSVDNLEWVNKSENMTHAYQTGLVKPHASYGMLGHKNPNAGRKGRKVMIIETGEIFNSIKDCAIAIGGSDRRICDCLKGVIDSYQGYHFEYA